MLCIFVARFHRSIQSQIVAVGRVRVENLASRTGLSPPTPTLTAEQKAAVAQVSPVSSRVRVRTPSVTNASPASEKIALFRRLLGGRNDVFPVQWDNPTTGKSGDAPACANESVRGVCGKPQVKCGDCPNQKFIMVSPDVIECHLRGEDRVRPNGRGGPFVAGVYPLLFDDTRGFLAADFDGDGWRDCAVPSTRPVAS